VNNIDKDFVQLQLSMFSKSIDLSFVYYSIPDDQIQRSVRKQNLKFLHNRILFSSEYFLFIKRLVQSNVQQLVNIVQQQQQQEDKTSFTHVNYQFILN
jgi:hypothetical protein